MYHTEKTYLVHYVNDNNYNYFIILQEQIRLATALKKIQCPGYINLLASHKDHSDHIPHHSGKQNLGS